MKKLAIGKQDILDVILGIIYSVLLAVGMILIFAVIVKFTKIPDSAIEPINIAIKTVAILFGAVFGIRSASKGAIKGLIIGLSFMGITYLLFSLIGGSFKTNPLTIYDALLMTIEGLISGIIAVNLKGRSKRAKQ